VSAILDGLVDLIAERVVQKLGGDGSDWVDQSASPLGPRRHRRAVNDRLASGRPGASRIGRKCLLSREALEEELATKGRKKGTPDEGESVEARLRRELGLEGSR
jgi:hypothetical protein